MVIGLDLSGVASDDVIVQPSPLIETMAMLHMLTEREHHLGQRSVVDSIRDRMADDLHDRVTGLAPLWARLRCRLFFPLETPPPSTWDEHVDALRDLDDDTFVRLAAEGVLGIGRHGDGGALIRDPARFVEACARRSTPRLELARRLVDDPRRFRDDLLGTLEDCWSAFAHARWSGVHSRLSGATTSIRAAVRADLVTAVAALSPTASAGTGSTVRFDKLDSIAIRVRGSALHVIPSVHHAPHITIKSGHTLPTAIVAPISHAAENLSIDALQRRLQALASPFRMGLLRHLLGEPITTSELALRAGVDAPQISRALSQLRDAAIVRSERVDGALVHRVDLDVLRRMGLDVVATIMR